MVSESVKRITGFFRSRQSLRPMYPPPSLPQIYQVDNKEKGVKKIDRRTVIAGGVFWKNGTLFHFSTLFIVFSVIEHRCVYLCSKSHLRARAHTHTHTHKHMQIRTISTGEIFPRNMSQETKKLILKKSRILFVLVRM